MHDPFNAFLKEPQVYIKGAEHGTLAGLTFGAKDVYDIQGYRTGAGNPDWLRTHPPAEGTASAVQVLLDAGATLVGKTHTDELTYSLNGENHHYGTPVNPNAPGRVPGGSSSGSAVVVAGKLVDFSIGSDTGGSVRLPASNCGVFGFRPTHGVIANDRVVPLAPSFDTVGWFTRDAALLERVGKVLLAGAPATGGKRDAHLLIARDAFEMAYPAVRPALSSALSMLAPTLGGGEEVVLNESGFDSWMNSFRLLQGVEVWNNFGPWIRVNKPVFGPDIHARFQWASQLDPGGVPAAHAVRQQVVARLDEVLGENGVLCLPTSPGIALPANTGGEELEQFRLRALALLCIAGLAGLPQVNLPLATFEGCPLGISLIGPRGSDLQLLALVRAAVAG